MTTITEILAQNRAISAVAHHIGRRLPTVRDLEQVSPRAIRSQATDRPFSGEA
jgi:hypothetical protein